MLMMYIPIFARSLWATEWDGSMEQEWDWLFGVETGLESNTVSGIVRRHCERNGEIISPY